MDSMIKARAQRYSVVVIGPMNPRLHHPLWYHTIGAISQQQLDEASTSDATVCIPPYSGFKIGGIAIVCNIDRWEISTERLDLRPRLFDISKIVFAKLFETPILVFGINTNQDVETQVPNVSSCLASAMNQIGIGLPVDIKSDASCSFHIRNSYPGRSITIKIQPSIIAKDLVHIAYNTEYETKSLVDPKEQYFDFGSLLEQHFMQHLDDACDNAKQIITMLKNIVEHNHAIGH